MTNEEDRPARGRRGGGRFPRGGSGGGQRRKGHDHGHVGPSFFGHGARAGRGNVRAAILALTAEAPMHGYQIIRELSERSGGRWSPSPGSVYPTLQMLEDEGLVSGDQRDGKRVFSITDAGRAVLAEREADRPAPWLEVGRGVDESLLGLRDLVGQLGAAVRQVAGSGTPAQVERTKALLTETRRSLYRILADDDESGATDSSGS